jgi:hypothetical protein
MTKLRDGMSYQKYMELYTYVWQARLFELVAIHADAAPCFSVAYDYCTSSKMSQNTGGAMRCGRLLHVESGNAD